MRMYYDLLIYVLRLVAALELTFREKKIYDLEYGDI